MPGINARCPGRQLRNDPILLAFVTAPPLIWSDFHPMEPNAPADEPAPEPPIEEPAAEAAVEPLPPTGMPDEDPPLSADVESSAEPAPGEPEEALQQLAERAQSGRLSAADEEQATRLVKECLLGGKSGVATAAAVLPKLAWVVGVSGATAAWPDMKAAAKTQLLKALADDESDAARRIRLSLARGLYKLQDVATTLKIGVAVAKEMRDKNTGDISPRNVQVFANVFLGKAKPWCALLPLAELKPADADALVHCALVAAFSLPHPPVTQLGVLKWAAAAGRLAKVHESTLAAVIKGVTRWSAKWQAALRKEIPELPEGLLAALKIPAGSGTAAETAEQSPAEATLETDSSADADRSSISTATSAVEGTDQEEPAKRRERPVYVSRTVPTREVRPPPPPVARTPAEFPQRGAPSKSGQFNLTETLRQIDGHVAWLKSELKNAENKLRLREDDVRRTRRKPEAPVIEGEPTPEELARLNVQLEARIVELQSRLDDLTTDSEARAASQGVLTDASPPRPEDQLRTLLALKLQEGYADFLALEQEARDLVVQQHYRTLLREVFDVLKHEGVQLTAPPEDTPPR
jgi:hypothetical protein